MALVSNGDGTAYDTGTGNNIRLTTVLAQGLPAEGYQAQSTPSPTSGTDDTARFLGGLWTAVIQGGATVTTAAFGGGSPAASYPLVGGKPKAPAPASGPNYLYWGLGGAALVGALDYFTGWPFGLFKKRGKR